MKAIEIKTRKGKHIHKMMLDMFGKFEHLRSYQLGETNRVFK